MKTEFAKLIFQFNHGLFHLFFRNYDSFRVGEFLSKRRYSNHGTIQGCDAVELFIDIGREGLWKEQEMSQNKTGMKEYFHSYSIFLIAKKQLKKYS